ncbi:hypothetical protein ACPCIX_28110 [Streptomyces pseudogriseolus]|uniref:Uncharacterized protein n=2 Tax=Streptomyces TaxID=1883 RepID=A0AB39NP92_9ACTN|nr:MULTISPECIES: hypothetical protein [Streptomyces]MCI4142288.1 hypothetical protein [Streptomyces sp. MMS20-AI2-20]GGQ02022.1 hypothetical protein GCM10010233_17770 [Streptomyces gancidicus]GGS42278.1 hypothetical protein GCM10010285_22300 [Streptomyces rubiginosus]
MNGPRRRALLASVNPMLEPGERIELVTIVTTSPVSFGRTAAFAVASAIVSGGATTMAPAPTAMHLVMTDRRFFLFRAEPMLVWPRELVMAFPRAGLVRSEIDDRTINSSLVLSYPGHEQSLQLTFTAFNRKKRNQMAAAVPVAG